LTTARTALALLAGALALVGCTDWGGYDLDVAAGKVPQLATMRSSVIPDPYQMPLTPPAGTVPVGHPLGDVPAPFTQLQLDSVGRVMTSPFPASEAVLARGRMQYVNNCAVCHGPAGDGNGPVTGQGKFPMQQSLVGPITAGRTDGYIYGVIVAGRGMMPPYGPRLTNADRWAIVHYVRGLQRAAGATPSPGTTPAAVTTAPAPGGAGSQVAAPGGPTAPPAAPPAAAPAGPDSAAPQGPR
jgi:mono/diheme cytochrome c family protein